MQRPAAEEFLRLLTERLRNQDVEARSSAAFVTPRRLCIDLRGLPEASPPAVAVRRGPRVGAPESAVSGFARAAGTDPGQLEIRKEPKGEFYFAVTERPGYAIVQILNQTVPDAVSAFRWPKSMRWGADPFRWVRPLRSIAGLVCTGSERNVLDFSVGGIRAGDKTRGHASMAPDEFSVSSFDDYKARLFEKFVIIDSHERERRIFEGARGLAEFHGLELVRDQALLEEISGLVEWPVPMIEEIDPRFHSLPQEILVTSMRSHQKYLAARSPETGRITHFIVVANREAADGGAKIMEGNRLVLTARLEDAAFVWNNDLRRISAPGGIGSMQADIEQISFHSRLGSLAAKVRRMESLSAEIAGLLGTDAAAARRAAAFVKADLASDTVSEFPELQGMVGRRFAEALAMEDSVAAACEEHYLPSGPSDRVPSQAVSAAVGLADRIDQLVGFFSIGEVPTGSKDPFALRRAALGIIRLCVVNGLRIPLASVLEKACREYAAQSADGLVKHAPDPVGTVRSVMGFVHERLAVHLRSQGIRHDIVNACVAMDDSDDLTLLSRRAEALAGFLGTEDGERLLRGFRRANNILEAERGRDIPAARDPSEHLASESAEKNLIAALAAADVRIKNALAEENLEAAMVAMADLSEPVDRFFEQVRVNADDPQLRENRLRLLAAVCLAVRSIADLTRIER